MKNEHAIVDLCAQLEVYPSGYYGWQKRRTTPGPRALEDQALAGRITELHAGSRATYGSPRLQMALRQQGHRHGRNRIARIMQETGICGRQKGRQRVPTTDSNHSEPIAPNHLAAAPATTAPNEIWVTDITYLPTQEGWL